MSTPDIFTVRRRARFARRVARAKKRGMVLLVTVSLLTLFLLIGVTYAVIAIVYRDSARANADRGLHEDVPERLLDSAFYTLIRDPHDNDIYNPLRGNGILRDKYGASVRGSTSTAINEVTWSDGTTLHRTGLWEFRVRVQPTSTTPPLHQIYNHYAGCVITFLGGPLKHISTRVVQHSYDTSFASDEMRLVVALENVDYTSSAVASNSGTAASISQTGFPVLINGREFSGAGAGFNITGTGAPWLTDDALMPNRRGESASQFQQFAQAGLNESYDAPDYQNAFLAALISDPNDENNILAVLPSFHDRALITYMTSSGQPKYRFKFRPSDDDPVLRANETPGAFGKVQCTTGDWNGDSTGSTPQWVGDVDNDNDGIPDSVWVDVGLPVRRSKSGRLVKPLVAFLCLDLDSRFNANFHGKFTDAVPGAKSARNDHSLLAGGGNTATLPEGSGWGPPEISLNSLLNDKTKYDALLIGSANYIGRYGNDQRPGRNGIDYPGTLGLLDVPSDYFDSAYTYRRGPYMSPADPHGRLAIGVNANGNPHQPISTNAGDERTDTDYEGRSFPGYAGGSAGSTAMVDQPFTPAELEAVLRQFDNDALSLPQRLLQIVDPPPPAPTSTTRRKNRMLLTTEGYDSPGPSFLSLGDLQRQFPGVSTGSFSHLASQRLIQADGSLASNPAGLTARLKELFSWELLRGEKMDLNRPFGNGVDDSTANGPGALLADEHCVTQQGEYNNPSNPKEFTQGFAAFVGASAATTVIPGNTIKVCPTNNNLANNVIDPRQLLARHLYCLAMLLKSQSPNVDLDGNGTNDNPQQLAHSVAQWAVNVVDFRDADSINTGFEYDIVPFDGWGVDGDLNTTGETSRGVVWGCERPELVMTETLCLHDRKTEDTDKDPSMKKTTDMPKNQSDEDFDQKRMPEGLTYIELFNPWLGTDRQSPELNTVTGQAPVQLNLGGTVGVQLDRTEPVMGCPVWRILVAEGVPANNFDPDAPAPGGLNGTGITIERSVYFTNYAGLTNQATAIGATLNHGQIAYYPNFPNYTPPVVAPGRYAVIGSSGRDPDGTGTQFTGYIGRNKMATDADPMLNQTRRIVLDTAAQRVQVYNPTAVDAYPAANVTVLPINAPRSFNISDDHTQLGAVGYSHTSTSIDPLTGEPLFDPPADEPFDLNRTPFMENQTNRRYRTLHLQRLANPLQPWNPNTNPYLTIDSRPADLTVYNGIDGGTETVGRNPIGPPMYDVASFEQGHEENAMAAVRRVLWRHSPSKPNVTASDPTTGLADHFFDYHLKHSLGFLNTTYQPYQVGGQFVGSPDTSTGPAFPWLMFANRPLNGPLEIMSVPRTSQSQLMEKAGYGSPNNMYNQSTYTFGHLMNYWHSSSNASTGSAQEDSLNLHRIFDFVTVPSRFADAKRTFNFVDMQYDASTTTGLNPTYQLAPPFNWVSTFRDPAKPNINTIYSPSMWNAILKGRTHPSWNQLVDSRRGYGAANDQIVHYENLPTYFANPFRSEGSGGLVPASLAGSLQRQDIDCTLLRSSHITPSLNPAAGDRPLIAEVNNNQLYNDHTRQPYFHTENLHRMSNLVGTRSNVFAIWLTLGYFEVDGNQLGAEVGSQTGEIERHRAFYIFDRSIPVAFEPGENHNVDKAVLVRRMIE